MFIKSYEEPYKTTPIAKCLKHNGQPINLLLTSNHLYIKSNNNMKAVDLKSNIRFSIRDTTLRFEMDGYESLKYTIVSDPQELFSHLSKLFRVIDYYNYYTLQQLMGSGSFASVYSAQKIDDGRQFAIKAFLKNQLNLKDPLWRAQIENEIHVIKQFNHPNILKLHEVYESQAQVYLITDLAKGGTLSEALAQLQGPLPFLSVKVIFRQLLESVKHIHNRGYMHRDLKPSNILFKQQIPLQRYGLDQQIDNLILSDFGVASKVDEFNVYSYCGSLGYIAPEVFKCQQDSTAMYNQKCDIFSLGCILYQLVTNKMLFQSNTHAEQKQLNMECKLNWYEIEREVYGSRQLTILLQRMLSIQPCFRPSCEDILNWPILNVEYDRKGIPLFKDYKRPSLTLLPRLKLTSDSSSPKLLSLKQKTYLNDTPKMRGSTFRIKKNESCFTKMVTDLQNDLQISNSHVLLM